MNTLPKGYLISPIVRTLRSKEGNTDTTLYQLNNKRHKLDKVFTSEEAAIRFITLFERERLERKALDGKGYQSVKGVAAMQADMEAAIELEKQTSSWLTNQSQPKIDGIYLDNVNRTLGH
jgi:hypothetical protein